MPHEKFKWDRFHTGKAKKLAFLQYKLVAIMIGLYDPATKGRHEREHHDLFYVRKCRLGSKMVRVLGQYIPGLPRGI